MKPIIRRRAACICALLLASATQAGPAHKKHIQATGSTEHCVSLRQVRSTQVLDDQTVLFRMKDGGVFRNVLDEHCPDLLSSGAFSYRPTGQSLCDSDSIVVLDRVVEGARCGLGQFEGVTETWGKPPVAVAADQQAH